MRLIVDNYNFRAFPAWEGGEHIKELIILQGKQREFEELLGELFPEGLTEQQLNDLLCFEDDWLLDQLGIMEDL